MHYFCNGQLYAINCSLLNNNVRRLSVKIAAFFCEVDSGTTQRNRYSKITETTETSETKQKAPPGGDGGACRNWLKVLSLHVDGAMPHAFRNIFKYSFLEIYRAMSHAAGSADSGQCSCQD